MVLYSTSRLELIQKNVAELEVLSKDDKVEGYIYTTLNIYGQAERLMDRYSGELTVLSKVLDASRNAFAVTKFYESAPAPLFMLAPFLGLVPEMENQSDMEQMCGVLHQLSQVIDFSAFVSVPKDVRKDVTFSLPVTQDYKRAWNDLIVKVRVAEVEEKELINDIVKTAVESAIAPIIEKIDVILSRQPVIVPAPTYAPMPATASYTPMSQVQEIPPMPTIAPYTPTAPVAEEEEEEYEGPTNVLTEDVMAKIYADVFGPDGPPKTEEPDKKEKSVTASAPVKEAEPEPEPVDEEEEEMSEYEKLIALYTTKK